MFNSVNPFVRGGTKGHTYLKNLHLKAAGLFKDVWPFVTNGHERVKTIGHV